MARQIQMTIFRDCGRLADGRQVISVREDEGRYRLALRHPDGAETWTEEITSTSLEGLERAKVLYGDEFTPKA